MRILFKIFPQKSHLNATFPLARALREQGHEVVYAGVEALRRYVEAQGNRYHVQAEDIFPYMEPKRGDPKLNYRMMVLNWYRNRAWADGIRAQQVRGTAFDALVKSAKPDLVLVDSPYTFFALSLFRLGVPFAMLESMGNLSRDRGFPPGDTAFVPGEGWADRLRSRVHWWRYFAKRWFIGRLGVRVDFDRTFVLKAARGSGVEPAVISFDRYFHLGIRTVPELILSPREFDFPRLPRKNQYYIGPSVEMNREESASDYRFARKFDEMVDARKKGAPLVYCSLGTAAWRYEGAERFVARVVEAARGAKWNLILAIGTELDLRMPDERPKNVEVFQVVPQLQVLRNIDLMITHGGMNSITECILAGVPMLVYPGTMQIDQGGNAARVVFHRLGLMGRMQSASVLQIKQSIKRILGEPTYQQRVATMGRCIRASDAYCHGAEILFDAVRRYFPDFDIPSSALLPSGGRRVSVDATSLEVRRFSFTTKQSIPD